MMDTETEAPLNELDAMKDEEIEDDLGDAKGDRDAF
jgi:hypothetical protein